MVFTFCNFYILFIIITNCFQINHFVWSNGHSISTINRKLPSCFDTFLDFLQLFIIHCMVIFSCVCYVCNLFIANINTISSYSWSIFNNKTIITHRALPCRDARQFKSVTQSKFDFLFIIYTFLFNR